MDRLKIQYDLMVENGKQASVLFYWIMYDKVKKAAYLSGLRLWEGSIMCEKSILEKSGIRYPSFSKGEDTPFIRKLIKVNAIYPIINPTLYIYTYNGVNTFSRAHFDKLTSYGQKLSAHYQERIGQCFLSETSVSVASKEICDKHLLNELSYIR